MNPIGRNELCLCGSGKKYKRCCEAKDAQKKISYDYLWHRFWSEMGNLYDVLLAHAKRACGPELLSTALKDFTVGTDIPSHPDLFSYFPHWFLFHWIPRSPDPASSQSRLSKDLPKIPLAQSYANVRGEHLSDFQKKLIEAHRDSYFSCYQVKEVQPGSKAIIKDLFFSQELELNEKNGSHQFRKGDVLLKCVLRIEGSNFSVAGSSFALPPREAISILDIRDRVQKKSGAITPSILSEIEPLLREFYFVTMAKLLTLPKLLNTDGEPIVYTTLLYELKCSPQEAFDQLKSLALDSTNEDLLADAKYDKNGKLRQVSLTWSRRGNAMHKEWKNTVLGNLAIDGLKLTVELNSEQRAKGIKKEIKQRLGRNATFKNAVYHSVEKMLEQRQGKMTRAAKKRSEFDLSSLPEVQSQMKEMVEDHWRNWLDTEIDALNRQTPRQACKTPQGRERLELLLLDLERDTEYVGDPILTPPLEELRTQLGLNP